MLPTPQLLNQVANFIKERGKNSHYCLFLLGKEVGLRVSEAVNFDLSLKKKANLYLINGKKHKKRHVFIDPQVIATLKQNNWKPQQTNRFSFAHYLQRIKRELNISKEIELTSHTLRRCFATYQANSGMPLPVLQKVLGHISIRTTALYWKRTNDPKEKIISDKWLGGRSLPEPPKPTENKPQELPKLLEIESNTKIFLNIHQETNFFVTINNKQLVAKNKLLQAKIRQLEQENKDQQQSISNLQINLKKTLNAKENLTKQLVQVQKEKDNLLKMITTDLQKQQQNLSNKEQNNQELHQQLIAQIEVLTKN